MNNDVELLNTLHDKTSSAVGLHLLLHFTPLIKLHHQRGIKQRCLKAADLIFHNIGIMQDASELCCCLGVAGRPPSCLPIMLA